MESAALPLGGKQVLDPAGSHGPRRLAPADERSDDIAFGAVLAVSSYIDSDAALPELFGRLSATVAQLSGARRAAFWRLGARGRLSLQPAAFGFEDGSHVGEARFELGAGGTDATERAIFDDQLDLVRGTSPELDRVWHAAGLRDVNCSMAASWRAGERRIGMVAVYDSPRGFDTRDFSALRVAGAAAGMLWQYRESEDELGRTTARLEEAMAARRHLLNNIAAGGDEARRRFASALHDDSLQLLTAAELQLERIRSEAKGSRHAANLVQLRTTMHQVEESLRRLLINVSPEPLHLPNDLNDAISERLESLRIDAGIEAHVESRIPQDVPPATQRIVLKNIAEALTNVQKHSRATRVTVVAEVVDHGLRVEVRDDGKGFVVAEAVRLPGHIGLLALRERAQLAGGWFRIDSEPGAGTKTEFWVPLAL